MRASLRPLGLTLGAFFALWTLWCALLVHPWASLDTTAPVGALCRMAARIAVWVGLVFAYGRRVEGKSDLGLIPFDGRAALAGLLASLLWLVPGTALALQHGAHLRPPASLLSWISTALSAPFAEELLFRGLVLRVLAEAWPRAWALLASSILFAASHLPYWTLSGAHAGADLALVLGKIALLGGAFGALYLWRRSVWAPLLAHGANNVVTTLVA